MNFIDNINKLVVIATAFTLVSCASAPWQKSPVKGDSPEDRVASAKQIQKNKPELPDARKDLYITNEQAVNSLMAEADTQRAAGHWDEAGALYNRVLALSPNNSRAISLKVGMERSRNHAKQLEEAIALNNDHKSDNALAIVRQILIEDPQYKGALDLQHEIRVYRDTRHGEQAKLKPPFNKPVTLELRDANIKMVFEALSKATGINFILDRDIKSDSKATVFVKKASIEDAIEMVLATNGLQKKVLSETNALVYPNTAQKFKDYRDLMVRSFYLTNGNAGKVAATLRTVLKIKDVAVDDRLNMLVIRDSPEVIRIAEKLVASNDLPDPEVMLDIEVLEVSRTRLQELGIQYPNQIAVNSLSNIATTTTTAVATTTTAVLTAQPLTLASLKNLNSGSFNVSPNPAVNFRKTTGDVNLLSNPRIRVRNNEKAKILVGDKIPIITTIAAANVGTSESVTYVDVGLKLDVEPRITLDDNVNIKIGLEVSSLGDKTVTKSGATVYNIGTRNASTILRLQDGETQVLAGLISSDERKNTSKLPGLGDIPFLGRLFSDQEDKKDKTEIVLTITPHVIGNIIRPEAEVMEYFSGTETLISDTPQIVVPVSGASGARGNSRAAPQEPLEQIVEPLSLPEPVAPEAPIEQNNAPVPTPLPTPLPVSPVNIDSNFIPPT